MRIGDYAYCARVNNKYISTSEGFVVSCDHQTVSIWYEGSFRGGEPGAMQFFDLDSTFTNAAERDEYVSNMTEILKEMERHV